MPEPTARVADVEPPEPSPTAEPPAHWGEYLSRLGPLTSLMAVFSATFPPIGSVLLFWNIKAVSTWLRAHTDTGPVIYAGAFALLGALALMPTYAFALLGGWAFGFPVGYAAALVGFVAAALIAYWIGRAAAGERVVRILEERPRWRAVYDALLRSSFGKTLFIITLIRLPPNSPFAVTNLVLSATRAHPLAYLMGTVLGMMPRTGVAVWLGATIGDEEFRLREVGWMFWIGIAASAAVLLIIGQIARRAVEKVTAGAA